MKKLIFGLIATIFISVSIYGQEIKLTDYGFYHNEGVSLFYENKNNVNIKDFNQIIDAITILMQNKYPTLIKDVNGKLVKDLMSKYSNNGFDFKSFWNSNKGDFIKNFGVPNRVEEVADKLVNNNLNFEESMKLITDFKGLKDISAEEIKRITVLESILISSNTYWNSSPNMRPGTAAILADGILGLVFCYIPPLAIIASASASIFVNETEHEK